LLLIKGEVLLGQAADQSVLAAEDCFDQAAKMARKQGALFGSCGSPSALPV
jgi:hypothetical protein